MAANARCLARLTGRSVHAEASPRSQTFDLVTAIRVRKWKWLGHILRSKGDRLTKLAIKVQFKKGDKLNMLQDVPSWCTSFVQLEQLAANRRVWRSHQPTRLKSNARSAQLESKFRNPPIYNLRSTKNKPATSPPRNLPPRSTTATNNPPPPFPIFSNATKKKKK